MSQLVLLSRLYRDLAELQDSPYPGVRIFFDDADIRQFCLVLTPPSGPWKDLSLHFEVEIPYNWPTAPPSVKSSVKGVQHPNLFGSYICCDLLKPQSALPYGYTGGYTPALALRGLFLQFLTFFSSTEVEQSDGHKVDIGDVRVRQFFREERDNQLQSAFPNGLFTSCNISPAKQAKYQAKWNDLEGVEHSKAITEQGASNVIHIVKSTDPQPRRIHCFEYDNPRRAETLKVISSFCCPRCPYGSSKLPYQNIANTAAQQNPHASVPLPLPPATCLLGNLDDDTLSVIISHLPTEYVFSFAQAYPRVRALAESLHTFLQRELECFFLRTPLDRSILGIGVDFAPKTRVLSSDFDWLSEYAFISYRVRKSIQKRDFSYFLPLAFSRSHFERAQPRIWVCLSTLYQKVQSAMEASKRQQTNRSYGSKPPPPSTVGIVGQHKTVSIIYRLMLNIVVSLMKSCDDFIQAHIGVKKTGKLLYASEKAIISYCHLFHLLICLSRVEPGIKTEAIDILKKFIEDDSYRHKEHNPDMGELIVIITLVLVLSTSDDGNTKEVTWETLAEPFLREAFTRNVRWNLKDSPDLEVMEEGPSEYRLYWTFQCSKTSLRLMMFQITFLDMFITTYSGESGFAKLDDNYGFAEQGLPEKMVEEIKAIYLVDDWPMFFKRVRFEKGVNMSVGDFSKMLRECVVASDQKGYHKAKSAHTQTGRRKNGEKKFAEERARLLKAS